MNRDGRPRYWRLGGTLADERRLSLADRLLAEGGGCGLRWALRVDAALSAALPDLPPDEVCALYGFDLEARDLAAELAGEEGYEDLA